MDWAVIDERISEANANLLGESITLPDGSTARGIFDPKPADPGGPFGSDVGRAMRLSQQSSPELRLLDDDAAALSELDTVIVRGVDYQVASIYPDGHGLTVIGLMPATASGGDELNRWR